MLVRDDLRLSTGPPSSTRFHQQQIQPQTKQHKDK
ncbi:unnamed protein product, partial [Rotaria magnacalcarata]